MECEEIKLQIKNEGTFSLEKGENVLSVLIAGKIFDERGCGGHGTCGKCTVRFLGNAPLPKPGDRRRFTPEQLRDGWRLACLARPQQDCCIEILFEKKSPFILTQSVLTKAGQKNDTESIVIGDLGTTTIVLQLADPESGTVLDTFCALNPQRAYGADVISRIGCAMEGRAEELSRMVRECVERPVKQWIAQGHAIKMIIIAGNTVMSHLYEGYDVSGLAKAPFTPVTTGPLNTSVCNTEVTFLPGISAFVGGDITAGMLVCREEMEKERVTTALLIDLGTNGEIALMGKDGILCTAAAAGPAFEGGFAAQIPGSDVISVVAELLEKGWLDETGLLAEPYFESGAPCGEFTIYREDIRKLQMAKAAIFAGIRILLEESGTKADEVERVYLAGGFGYKLNVEAACKIGLIPDNWAERTIAVGNTALAGAYLYGKELIRSEREGQEKSEPAGEIIRNTKSINLAESEAFDAYYLQAMELGKKGI
nr:DUF4445 domain-containing protein [Lachnospiraceae bacterium]